jgi:hypothetical protein
MTTLHKPNSWLPNVPCLPNDLTDGAGIDWSPLPQEGRKSARPAPYSDTYGRERLITPREQTVVIRK